MKEIEKKRRPTIVFLHSTHKCEEWLRPLLEGYASRGYIIVAIDSRYHGERATSITYRDALVSSWKNGDTMPFIFDTIILLRGKMSTHEDRNHWRVSWRFDSELGMHAWFAAFVDTHYSVVVPIVGVQVFGWAVEHDKWQARVNSIKAVFEEARADLDKSAIDKEVVQKVWDRIAPGLASQFDAPYTVPAIVPRPLLILTAEKDHCCPLGGLVIPESRACKAYEEASCPQNFNKAHLQLAFL
ncbi:hypothetical protein P3L10_023034 [Capsicum annuum]